ncbi:MAG: hypothetical protein DMG73_07045 [Acidobacteria bacterium]|nr:MAG: hypothetical protein DMG73_07045 [Acidobacteriota bacterium]
MRSRWESHRWATSFPSSSHFAKFAGFRFRWGIRTTSSLSEAAEIGRHHDFKYGINVELVTTKDKQNIEARFFERGVGETQSSGTGSCAAAVASMVAKKAESAVCVHTPGGVQSVRWEGQVFLAGAAQLICRGEFLS